MSFAQRGELSYIEVALQELPEESREHLEAMRTRLGFTGVLIGALVPNSARMDERGSGRTAREGGDAGAPLLLPVRGLLLERGKTWILRRELLPESVVPLAAEFFEKYGRLSVLGKLRELGPAGAVESLIEGRELFYARYFQPAAPSQDVVSSREVQVEIARAVIQQLLILHENGLVHGHLAVGNLVGEGGAVSLTDAGIDLFAHRDITAHSSLSSLCEEYRVEDQLALMKFLRLHCGELSFEGSQELLGRTGYLSHLELQLPAPTSPPLSSAPPPPEPELPLALQQQPPAVIPEPNTLEVEASPLSESLAREKPAAKESAGWRSTFWIPFLGCCGLAFWLLTAPPPFLSSFIPESDPILSAAELDTFWSSGDQEKMLVVARKAVLEEDPAARASLFRQIEGRGAQKKPPLQPDGFRYVDISGVIELPLLLAKEVGWYEQFSPEDRRSLFAFSLAPLLKAELPGTPDFSVLHPGVSLALLGGLPREKNPQPLFSVVLEMKERLAPRYVAALDTIRDELGSAHLFQSYLQLQRRPLVGPALQLFFFPQISLEALREHVVLLGEDLSAEDQKAVMAQVRRTDVGKEIDRWFRRSPTAEWNSVSSLLLFDIAYRSRVPKNLSFVQITELLKAPFLEQSREALVRALVEQQEGKEVLDDFYLVIANSEEIDRERALALVAALGLKGDTNHAFVERWFEAKPNPQLILELLLSLRGSRSFELFTIPAARYLKESSDWQVTEEQLPLLAGHPEPLARGLAYQRADPARSDHRELLERRARMETSPSLKKMLQRKLE